MSNIRLDFDIEAPIEKVYAAITEASGINGWWTTDTDLEAKEGSAARFGFGPQGDMNFTVVELETNKHVRWDSVSAPPPDWQGTHLTFDLESGENGTKVKFAHKDFATEEGSYAYCTYQWAYFLESLKSYIETGTGKPATA